MFRIVAVKKLEQLEEEEKATHRAIHAAEFARKANESAKEELQSQLTELKVREGKLDQERFSNGEQLRRLEREVESLVKDLRQNRTLLASMEADLKKTQTESVKQIEDLNQYKLKKAEASQEAGLQTCCPK